MHKEYKWKSTSLGNDMNNNTCGDTQWIQFLWAQIVSS